MPENCACIHDYLFHEQIGLHLRAMEVPSFVDHLGLVDMERPAARRRVCVQTFGKQTNDCFSCVDKYTVVADAHMALGRSCNPALYKYPQY